MRDGTRLTSVVPRQRGGPANITPGTKNYISPEGLRYFVVKRQGLDGEGPLPHVGITGIHGGIVADVTAHRDYQAAELFGPRWRSLSDTQIVYAARKHLLSRGR